MPKKTAQKPRPMAEDNPNTSPTTIRLDPDLLAALDTWAKRLSVDGGGPQWTRVDVIRASLRRAVKERGEKGEAP